jgi:hypothetical protein
VKELPPCEQWLNSEFGRDDNPKLLSRILNLLPIGGPINELVNLHNCEGAKRRSNPD